jgi:cellulose synthase/poly-beta-1,6-N-acetylglucosamine synthase-like glycosyltransferase
MDFTFGIITCGENDTFIEEMIESIIKNNIPNYEIIIVGNTNINETDNIKITYFDIMFRLRLTH